MPTPTTLEIEFGGRTLTLETGKLAGLAGGAVTLRYGDSMVLGTANRSEPRPGLDFFPLTVDFEERMYAAGKIPGGFIKREGRASEAATLAARLTDRPIRPLFPEGYKDDVQIVITVLSTDHENDPDILGTIAASAALTISEIPFQGPVGAVRVGYIDGEYVLNPTYTQLAGLPARPRRLGHPRRDHDGRGGRQDPARGRHGRGHPVRAPLAAAAHRAPGEAARARRQAEAPAVPRAPHGLRAQVRRAGEGGRRVRRRRRRDHGHRPEDVRPRRGRRGPGQGRQDHRPLVDLRQRRAPDRRQPDARHHRQGHQGRAEPRRGRPQGARLRRQGPARRPFGRLRHRVPRGGPRRRHAHRVRARTWTRSSSPARGIRTSRTTSSARCRTSSASSSRRATARCRTPRRPPTC